jgi:hypothetical protein
MEELYFDSHLERHSDEKGNKNEFSFIINNLPAREKHALETLKITSIDELCKYDLSKLFVIRGYGATTVKRLQLLQKRFRGKEPGKEEYDPLTLLSPIKNIRLSGKEHNVLALLNIMTVGEFLNVDLSKMILPKGFGEKTRYLLAQSKKQILQELPIDSSLLPLEEHPVLMLPLNPREKKTLLKFRISTWREFAYFDFHQTKQIPNTGSGTLQSLLCKQTDIRAKFVCAKIDSLSDISYDDEYSVFLLDLTPGAKEILWDFGVTRISELTKTNLNILKFFYPSVKKSYEELYQIQRELSPVTNETENLLNNFLASTPVPSVGISNIATKFFQQKAIHSLRDFLFFTIAEEHPVLRKLQSEWQSRYTPAEFLHTIPSYSNLLFYRQKNQLRNSNIGLSLDNFKTVKDFLSVSFKDIVKLTGNNLETARIIQSAQYELLKSCLDFHKCFDFSVNDEREEGWRQKVSEESLSTLPFFSGKHNRNFSVEMFHETFLPDFGLDSIVKRNMLQITKKIGILSLGELLLTPCSYFWFLKYCSKTKIAEVQEKIQKILLSATNNSTQTGLTQTPPPPPPIFFVPLLPLDQSTPEAFFVSLLKRYINSDRVIDIAVQRIRGKTLEKIAQRYGITRERIRQIENKYKNRSDLAATQGVFAEVSQMLEKSITALQGFAPLHKITTQFAVDNGWSEQDCTQLLVKFLLDRITDKIVNHGKGYYSIKSYPCERCELLVSKITDFAEEAGHELLTDHDLLTRNNLLATLLNTCCSGCVDLPPKISEFFLDWKCISDPLYSQLFRDDEIYRSTNRSMQKMVSNVLKRSTHPLNVKEILTLIHYRTQNNSFTKRQVSTAVFVLSTQKKEIFLWDRGGIYAHRKHIPVDNPLLITIEQKLKQLIKKAKTPYLSLYTLFSEYQPECEAEGIPSAHALHACLNARGVLGVAFMRSPCISVTNEKHERRNVDLLENWVAQKKGIISCESLKHYAQEIGLNALQYNSTYGKLKSLVRYEPGLIVHLNSLDWNQAKQESILLLAKDYWNDCISQGSLYARADQLLSEYEDRLPELAHGITWTFNLLFSLLLQSESVITFGNTYLVYSFKNGGSAPQTFGDVIVEILKRTFGGKAKLNEISSYLRDDLQLVRARLTASMLHNHPSLIITKHEIYLAKGKNVS